MMWARLLLFGLLVWTDLAAAGTDDRWVRKGVDNWGNRIAAQMGVPGFGRSIAIVVAVGDYQGGWTPIEAPALDAERMTEFFRNDAGFDIVYTITDEMATRQRIRNLMVEELPEMVGPDDRVVFYFSGHGT